MVKTDVEIPAISTFGNLPTDGGSNSNSHNLLSPSKHFNNNASPYYHAMGTTSSPNGQHQNFSNAKSAHSGHLSNVPVSFLQHQFPQTQQGMRNFNYVTSMETDNSNVSNITGDWKNSVAQINGQNSTPKTVSEMDDRSAPREIKSIRPLQGVAAALRTLERFKNGEIKSEVAVKAASLLNETDFPEEPTLINTDVYESKQDWQNTWKPENLEKIYPEVYIKDLKSFKDVKGSMHDFRKHVESLNNTTSDEIWFAKDIPIMHNSSCINSKKNKHCMGCSSYWKTVQSITEPLRPWGNDDVLRFETEHSETFLGYVSMNGSFIGQQIEMLACDAVNTFYHADDPNAVAIWGFIAPTDVFKLTEEDSLGVQFFDHKGFIDPSFVEKKVKVRYAIQKPQQTIIVPSGWVHFVVRVGRGLSFSGSWNILRLAHLGDARRSLEFNRSIGVYKPLNISSLVVSAAYAKLDEAEASEPQDRSSAIHFLAKLFPILKVQALEEILGERLTLSSLVILSYAGIVEKLRKNGRKNLPPSVQNELEQVRGAHVLPAWESNAAEEEEDIKISCSLCKFIIFNSRRTCTFCKGYDLCEPCFGTVGNLHQHKMKKIRKMPVQSLLDLIESMRGILEDSQFTEPHGKKRKETSPVTREKRESDDDDMKETFEMFADGGGGGPGTRSGGGHSNYNEEEVINCICGNNKDLGFMISCEKCLAWLHGKCVGISKRNEPEIYYCPRCVKKSQATSAKLNPKSFSPEEKLREYKLVS